MIRAIVAIDEKRGMANEEGIPWNIPSDGRYFTDTIQNGTILMGYGTYIELKKPFHDRTNYVATSKSVELKSGFEIVTDVDSFLVTSAEDVWIIGGPGLIRSTLDTLDEIYITQLEGDFHCTKFLPDYTTAFKLQTATEPIVENGIRFRYETWRRVSAPHAS